MKHAGSQALDQLEGLLAAVRAIGALKERSRGVFYLKSRALLHFHEDRAGLFADVRALPDGDFERIQIDTETGRALLLQKVSAAAR